MIRINMHFLCSILHLRLLPLRTVCHDQHNSLHNPQEKAEVVMLCFYYCIVKNLQISHLLRAPSQPPRPKFYDTNVLLWCTKCFAAPKIQNTTCKLHVPVHKESETKLIFGPQTTTTSQH